MMKMDLRKVRYLRLVIVKVRRRERLKVKLMPTVIGLEILMETRKVKYSHLVIGWDLMMVRRTD